VSVLICYDGSESARHALEVANATLGHEPATVLHIWNPPVDVLPDAFGAEEADDGPATASLEHDALARAQEIAHEGQELARERGLNVEARVERNRGSVWETILDVAREVDAELIVVGTHGTTAVQPALLGSVSSAFIHHSDRPVLVVPRRPEKQSNG